MKAPTFALVLMGCSTSAAAPDAGTDASSEASTTPDGGSDAGVVYHDMTNVSYWSSFDMATVDPKAAQMTGTTFDGRYLYMAPFGNYCPPCSGTVARYDTTADFATGGSWTTFDMSTVNANARGFEGMTFDGKFVYFAPYVAGAKTLVTRYDTSLAFNSPTSWATFDTAAVNANYFSGATYDGSFVYFVPGGSLVTRYDTAGTFTSTAAWSTFDTTTVNANASNFGGAIFDGQYVYLIPHGTFPSATPVTRYDTTSSFTSAASWSTFDVTTLSSNAEEFGGGAFDGRYLYLVSSALSPIVVRYDTKAAFASSSSWSTFDPSTVDSTAKIFSGAAFDGRYVYLLPFGGKIARYDTMASFTAPSSWSTFDTTTVAKVAYSSGGFDGRYLYLVPWSGALGASGVVARFDARVPPGMPPLPQWHGSFF